MCLDNWPVTESTSSQKFSKGSEVQFRSSVHFSKGSQACRSDFKMWNQTVPQFFSLMYACMLRFQELPEMFMKVCCFSELLFWAGVKILPRTSVVASSKVKMQLVQRLQCWVSYLLLALYLTAYMGSFSPSEEFWKFYTWVFWKQCTGTRYIVQKYTEEATSVCHCSPEWLINKCFRDAGGHENSWKVDHHVCFVSHGVLCHGSLAHCSSQPLCSLYTPEEDTEVYVAGLTFLAHFFSSLLLHRAQTFPAHAKLSNQMSCTIVAETIPWKVAFVCSCRSVQKEMHR